MISLALRLIGWLLLAVAIVAAVQDITRSIAASKFVFVSLGAAWSQFSLNTIQAAQGAIQGYVHPFIWDPVIQTVLLWPTWLVFAALALIFFMLGRRRKKALGRFAQR